VKKLILVMGLPGSGKSFFAERLASTTGAEYFNSDLERNRLGGRGKYTPGDKLMVYNELVRLAKARLDRGHSVIIDATFHLQQMRDLFVQLAEAEKASIYYLYITAAEDVIIERLKQPRAHSEADLSVYQKIKKEFDPFGVEVLILESGRDNIEHMLQRALKFISHEKN
jgi:predicted kinase